MADPFSIIGTTVGVASLGVQACQTLVRYYSQFKSFDEDICTLVLRAEGLEATLQVLESLQLRVGDNGIGALKQLEQAIQVCAKGIFSLTEKTAKYGQLTPPTSVEARRRLLKKRLFWPFKRDALMSLRDTLDGLQANLQVALQVYQMYELPYCLD